MGDNAPRKVKTGVTGQPVSWLGEACALSAWLQDLVHLKPGHLAPALHFSEEVALTQSDRHLLFDLTKSMSNYLNNIYCESYRVFRSYL